MSQSLLTRYLGNLHSRSQIFLLLILFGLFGFNNVSAQDENLEMVRRNLNKFFPQKFQLTTLSSADNPDGDQVLSGDATFFGANQTKLVCLASGTNLKEVSVAFPESAGFNVGDVQRICGTSIQQAMPRSVSAEAGVNISDFMLKLGDDGQSVERLDLNLVSKNWNFLDFGSLKIENLIMGITYAGSNVSGQLSGQLSLGNLKLNVASTIPTKKEDWVLTTDYTGDAGAVSIGDALRSIGGEELVNSLLTPEFAGFFSKQTIPSFKLEASPFKKEIKLTSNNDAGNSSLIVNGKGDKPKGNLFYNPPANFKFSELESSLAWMDGINMPLSEIQLVIGNQPTAMGTHRIAKGLGIQSKINLPPEIEKLLGSAAADVKLFGQIANLKSFRIGADLNINADLGSGISMEKVGLGLESELTEKTFFVDGKMTFPVDDATKIRFGFELGAAPTSSTFSAGLNMEAVNGNNDISEWYEPFGIPYVGISHLSGTIGLNPTTIVSRLDLAGDLRIGKRPEAGQEESRIQGSLKMDLNIASPLSSEISGSLKKASFANIIKAFDPSVELSGPVRKALESEVESLSVKIQPADGAIEIGGAISLFGKSASLNLKAGRTSGIAASGTMDKIEIGVGDFDILSIKGKDTEKPSFDIAFGVDPKVKINGAIKLLGKETSGNVEISKSGFSIEIEDKLFDLLEMKTKLTGGALDDKGGMAISIELKQNVLETVKTEVTDFIKEASKGAEEEIKEAQAKLEESKKNANDAEKFFLDIGSGFLDAANEVQGAAAVAGMAITKGILEAVDIKSIKFAGAINSLSGSVDFEVKAIIMGSEQSFDIGIDLNTADATSFIEGIGEAIGEAVLDGLNPLEGEWDGMKGELNEFAKEFTKVFEDAIVEIEKAFDAVADVFEGFAKDLDEMWNGETYEAPRGGGALAEIKPGIRHYSVTVDRMVVNAADDGYSAGGVVTEIFTVGQAEGERDRTLELYGPISMEILGAAESANGTNGIFWSRNRGNTHNVGTGTISINQTKHFYAQQNAVINAVIYGRMWEYDDGAKNPADDKIYGGTPTIGLSNLNGTQAFSFACHDPNGDVSTKITVYGSVTAHPMMTAQDVRNAIATNDVNRLKEVLRKGGDIKSVQPLDEAVNGSKLEMVKFFLANGYKPNTNHLNTAIASGSYNQELVKRLLVRGAKPTDAHLEAMIKKQDKELVPLIVERGIKPNLGQYNWLIGQKNYKLAGYLLDHGVAPTQEELKTAVQSKDITAARLVINKGVKSDVASINQVIGEQNVEFFQLLSATQQPDQSSLKKAAEVNSTQMFQMVLAKGLTVTDGGVLNMAMDKNNMEITKLALDNGANATNGLRHAISGKKREYIDVCLDYGANSNEAINYAVTSADMNLAESLINEYNASGDKMLAQAVTSNKIDFARLALDQGKANPDLQLKTVTDKGDVNFANLLLDFDANPNLGMDGTIKNVKPELLARLISMGADVNKPDYVKVAAEKRSLPMLQLLVDSGAKPDPGMPAAVGNDDFNIVRYLLAMGASPKGHVTTSACNSKPKTVELLLQYGGDANEGMKCATEKNMEVMTLLLLEYGANPEGYIAIPSEKGYYGVVVHLVNFGADPLPGLKPGAKGNHTHVVKFLLENGAIPNDILKVPSGVGNAEMVKDLCDYGDLPQPGMEPCARNGHVPVAKVLVSYGADPKPYDYIRVATANNRDEMVTYLISQGADPNTLNSKNESLLHIAANRLQTQLTVKALLDGGCTQINSVESTLGNTPLHVAAHVKNKKGVSNMETVVLLVEAGANINAINTKGNNGKTVLAYTLNPKIKKYLKNLGALALSKKARELPINNPAVDEGGGTDGDN